MNLTTPGSHGLLSGLLDRVLFHETTILSRLDEMAQDITRDYEGRNLKVIAILHGGIIFTADLLRRIHLPLKIDSVSVASYHGGTESSGVVTFNQLNMPEIEGEHVLLMDDILDSGRTLSAIREKLTKEGRPASIKICVLLDKKIARAVDIDADYSGFEISDEFVVGYGLDYRGDYRNLPFIASLSRSAVAEIEGEGS
ncbi:MAG: hypoxanthine phosphoribosyltransferase [Verrucomicrobiales bacterium]